MAASGALPAGFRYQPGVIDPDEERTLIAHIARLPLREFEFQGYLARRRVLSYGWHYDFGKAALHAADAIPAFLYPLRNRAAELAGLAPEELPHALLTEYRPGTAIGWHKDKAVFGDVVGISLLSACLFRFRRNAGAARWERRSLTLEPRSAYLLHGESRMNWEHSIPPVGCLRYSITFRSLRRKD